MTAPSSLTLNYNAILASTLFNYQKGFVKNVGNANYFLHALQKQPDGYVGKSTISERAAISLMYGLGQGADSYAGYDPLALTPTDGFTMAFYDWRQAAIPVSISGDEELKNDGEAKLFDLLKGKVTQAEMGIEDFFSKALLQGAAGSAITTPYTSPANGSVFVDPLFKIIRNDIAGSVSVGNIDQSTSSWWANQYAASVATAYVGFRNELRHMYHLCTLKPGGAPNLHLTDMATFELYERSLEYFKQNTSMDADIPFDNLLFKGKPVTYDEYMPCTDAGTAAQNTASGSWAMINTKFFQIQYHKRRNFAPTNMQTPYNQDARVSHILWYGALVCSNRAKQGLLDTINTAVVV